MRRETDTKHALLRHTRVRPRAASSPERGFAAGVQVDVAAGVAASTPRGHPNPRYAPTMSMVPPTRELVADHVAEGRAARAAVPRSTIADWHIEPGRVDPVDLIEWQAQSRDPGLVPLRHARMGVSPFTFFRGSALVMARDLASLPSTGLTTQLCGDAHLSNFGLFASEDRRVVFDVNDFDETFPGTFEWDLKRLATSFVLAARSAGLGDDVGRAAAVEAARAYRATVSDYAAMPIMRVWYDRMESRHVESIVASSAGKVGKRAVRDSVAKAQTRDTWSAVRKLTRVVDGHRRFRDQPPLLTPLPLDGPTHSQVLATFDSYRESLTTARRHLLDRFTIVDLAHKFVGVGSVGLYAWIVLLEGRSPDDVLVLQFKQAQKSVVDMTTDHDDAHEGRRVVQGQRLMQAAGDVFLGWTTGPLGIHYYGRQLRDMKWSPDPDSFTASGLLAFARLTASALARSHARSGDPVAISAYLGSSNRADLAIGEFAVSYANQAEVDFAEFSDAVASGRLPTTELA
jgi:uncharacterized protein (DUF2252 family)